MTSLLLDDNYKPLIGIVRAGSIALSSPPTQTNVGADTALTFTQQVNHFQVQNTTTANAYVELDAAATTGSFVLLPNASWRDDIQVTTVHIYTVAAQPVNAQNGIIVRGWV